MLGNSVKVGHNSTQATRKQSSIEHEDNMTEHATGTFKVNLTPQQDGPSPAVGRMIIDKKFSGDLEASSEGQMLMASTAVQGSAGYVAIEKVTGTLNGRRGSFY